MPARGGDWWKAIRKGISVWSPGEEEKGNWKERACSRRSEQKRLDNTGEWIWRKGGWGEGQQLAFLALNMFLYVYVHTYCFKAQCNITKHLLIRRGSPFGHLLRLDLSLTFFVPLPSVDILLVWCWRTMGRSSKIIPTRKDSQPSYKHKCTQQSLSHHYHGNLPKAIRNAVV